ncbi:MAG: efflux system, outer rane lipoprotein NodT family [Bacteroidetes bacterium]|nr:efflux system, outer rane lipoprotein NodT family [Bacteroidota bacterium]
MNNMNTFRKYKNSVALLICMICAGCKTTAPVQDTALKPMPQSYSSLTDSISSAEIKWKDFFSDRNLVALIDTALKNNVELMMTLQEIEVAKSGVRFRKGLLFPTVSGAVGYSNEKVGRYTSEGAGDAVTEITPGRLIPDPLSDYTVGLKTSWEVDVWGKMHNARKAAFSRYLGTIEGRNFVITNLVAEVADTYYELLSLDNELEYIRQTITLQENALEILRVQKDAALVTELAVKQFEAEVFNSQSLEYDIQQQITENENKLNFLLGRYPQPIARDKASFGEQLPMQVKAGIPSQLLKNRPDIRQAELELYATKCDVKAAKAEFYPSLSITGLLGFRGFKPSYLFMAPESIVYSIVGDLTAPLINRSAIKAEFSKAKAEQLEAMYNYQETILNGYVEVSNQLSSINNLQQAYDKKAKAVEALTTAIGISNDLFRSGKANYLEVLMTQREALDSKLELIEAKKHQFNAVVNIYKALGGGWR